MKILTTRKLATRASQLLASWVLVSGSAAVWSQTALVPAVPPAAAQPAGTGVVASETTWVMMVPGLKNGLCEEVYRFSPDGTASVRSAAAEITGRFQIAVPDAISQFQDVSLLITQTNGQAECQGRVPVKDSRSTFKLRQHASGKWLEMCLPPYASIRDCAVLWRLTPGT